MLCINPFRFRLQSGDFFCLTSSCQYLLPRVFFFLYSRVSFMPSASILKSRNLSYQWSHSITDFYLFCFEIRANWIHLSLVQLFSSVPWRLEWIFCIRLDMAGILPGCMPSHKPKEWSHHATLLFLYPVQLAAASGSVYVSKLNSTRPRPRPWCSLICSLNMFLGAVK